MCDCYHLLLTNKGGGIPRALFFPKYILRNFPRFAFKWAVGDGAKFSPSSFFPEISYFSFRGKNDFSFFSREIAFRFGIDISPPFFVSCCCVQLRTLRQGEGASSSSFRFSLIPPNSMWGMGGVLMLVSPPPGQENHVSQRIINTAPDQRGKTG